MALLLVGCASASEHGGPARGLTTLTLRSAGSKDLPRELQGAGFQGGFFVPAGWYVSGYGAAGDAGLLAVTVRRSPGIGAGGNESVAIDRRTGRAVFYPQVNADWYSGNAIAARGWLVHEERQQLDASKCAGGAADDCFSWQLYAARIGNASEHLLASSRKPGSQEGSPIPHLAGNRIVWLQSSADRPGFDLDSWTPGSRAPLQLMHTTSFAQVSSDDGTLLLSAPQHSGPNQEWRVQAVGPNPSDNGAYIGRLPAAIHDGVITYLPYHADSGSAWQVAHLRPTADATAATASATQARGSDAFDAEYVTDQYAFVASDESVAVLEPASHRLVTSIPVASSLSLPRAAGSSLTLVHQSDGGEAVIAWRSFPPG